MNVRPVRGLRGITNSFAPSSAREYLRRKLPEIQDRLRASGAIPIDARQPLDQVVDAILSGTLASSATGQASTPGNQPGSPARPRKPSRIT